MRVLPYAIVLAALAALSVALYLTDASASIEKPTVQTYLTKTAKQWHARAVWRTTQRNRARHQIRRLTHELAVRGQSEPIMAIRFVFGRYAEEAIRVSSCETGGTFDTGATNGQYLGLFQMGDYARSRYGHGPTAIEQAKYAYAYFAASGFDWSPWECKP